MAFTQTQIDALYALYAQGILTVRHGDKQVTYSSLAEMWAAIQRMERSIASPAQPSYVRLTSKGY